MVRKTVNGKTVNEKAVNGEALNGDQGSGRPASAVCLKFIEEQPQILRLTTPELHPKEQRPLFGDPGTERRSGSRSLRMTARFVLRISDSGTT